MYIGIVYSGIGYILPTNGEINSDIGYILPTIGRYILVLDIFGQQLRGYVIYGAADCAFTRMCIFVKTRTQVLE